MHSVLLSSVRYMSDVGIADRDLVAAAIRDPEEFSGIVVRYEGKLLRYIRRFTSVSQQCAEDILQEAFIKMYRNLNNIDPSLNFSSWAYRVVHNEALNYIRDNTKHISVSIEADDDDTRSLIEVLKSEVDIARDATDAQLIQEVRSLLNTMPTEYREVLILKYLEDQDYREISDIIKKPMGTVATLLNRAKAHFKKCAVKSNIQDFI